MTTDPFDFKGRTVFVAGGSSGINLGIADAFARHGASVAILGRSQERIDTALAQLRAHGGAAEGYSADVRDAAAVADALPASDASAKNVGTDRKKAWKDRWGCGQGIAAVDEVVPAAELVARLQREYRSARLRLMAMETA